MVGGTNEQEGCEHDHGDAEHVDRHVYGVLMVGAVLRAVSYLYSATLIPKALTKHSCFSKFSVPPAEDMLAVL